MNARQANKYLKKRIAKLETENALMYRTIKIDKVINSLAQNTVHGIGHRNNYIYCPNCGARIEESNNE